MRHACYSRNSIEVMKKALSRQLSESETGNNCRALVRGIRDWYNDLSLQSSFQDSRLDGLDLSVLEQIYLLIGASELLEENLPADRRNEAYRSLMGDNGDLNGLIIEALVNDVKGQMGSWEEAVLNGHREPAMGSYGYSFFQVIERENRVLDLVKSYRNGDLDISGSSEQVQDVRRRYCLHERKVGNYLPGLE